MQSNKIIVIGGGGHGKVVVDSLLRQGSLIAHVVDPRHSAPLLNIPRLPAYSPELLIDAYVIVAIGDNQARRKVAMEVKHKFVTAIDPSAVVSPNCVVGEGAMILHRAVIQAAAKVGRHVIINTGAQVDHDCDIGDYVHIAPRAVLCGTVSIGEGSLVGAGAVIIPNIRIGKNVVVGAGAVVIRDVPDNSIVIGNPARSLSQRKA